MDKSTCVAIPIYKRAPDLNEYRAIVNNVEKLKEFDIYYFAPEGFDAKYYPKLNTKVVFFPQKYFRGLKGYSRLLLSMDFYDAFNEYLDIMIVQPDVWIIHNVNDKSAYCKYDYIGAPWANGIEAYRIYFKGMSILLKWFKWWFMPHICYVGNGGLSYRKISACKRLILKNSKYARNWGTGEDVFFSYFGDLDANFNVAPIEVAESFSLEINAEDRIAEGIIPVGIHAWEKWFPDVEHYFND